MTELEELDDKELHDRIEKARLSENFIHSYEGKLIKEAAIRIIDKAVAKFALQTKADNLREIIELQTIIRKYRFGLFDEMKLLIQEGEFAFEELKERDLLRESDRKTDSGMSNP